MAPQHSGFIHEYPLIRVDNFTAHLPRLPSSLPSASRQDLPEHATHFVHPHILLLSHCHTDHLAGLLSVAKHGAPIYCSEVTKRLLLALERKEDRLRYDQGIETRRVHPYAKLQKSQRQQAALARQMGGGSGASSSARQGWDLLVALPFDEPIEIEYSAAMRVRLTLLSANHMPGSTMFLIQGPRGSVLHTGDVRTEAGFVEKLLTQTHLGTLSVQLSPTLDGSPQCRQDGVMAVNASQPQFRYSTHDPSVSPKPDDSVSASLSHLYLDTERLLDCNEPPTKSSATVDVVQLLRLLPSTQRVHINCWTSGYEGFLLAITKAFRKERGKIHIDRYKGELYRLMSLDPEYAELGGIVSTDRAQCGRFCACDAPACMETAIQIKPDEGMSASTWHDVKVRLRKQLRSAAMGKGELPTSISIPLQRHSPLRELYRTIALLRPRRVTANTAAASARFILARISERLRLTVMGDDDAWQKSCSLVRAENEERQWSILESAWQEAGTTGQQDASSGAVTTDASFFERVGRFKRLLYGLRNDLPQRLRMEMLDAEALMGEEDYQQPRVEKNNEELAAASSTNAADAAPFKAQIWNVPGKYASLNASPFRTQAMASTTSAPDPPPVIAQSASAGASTSHARILQQIPPPGQAVLTVELASRYLAYTAMYLGWRIRNPSRYSQDVAWRALRKMRPELARKTEEALQKELGWPIPPWSAKEGDTTAATSSDAVSAVNSMTLADTSALPKAAEEHAQPSAQAPTETTPEQLEQRLSVEAESQGQLFARSGPSAPTGDTRPDVSTTGITTTSEAMRAALRDGGSQSPEVAEMTTIERLFVADQCLRCNRRLPRTAKQGPSLFDEIVQDWAGINVAQQRPATIYKDGASKGKERCLPSQDRRAVQLTLVGVAAKSKRARRILGWDGCDFAKAHESLQRICSADASQGKAVKRQISGAKRAALGESTNDVGNRQAERQSVVSGTACYAVPEGWPGRTLAVLQHLSTLCDSSQDAPQSTSPRSKRRRVFEA